MLVIEKGIVGWEASGRKSWVCATQASPWQLAWVAAVADWRPETAANSKLKKRDAPTTIKLAENPDILAGLARHTKRPSLVIGFAAGGIPTVKVNRLLLRNVSVIGVGYGEYVNRKPGAQSLFEYGVNELVKAGLRPPPPIITGT